MNMKDDLYFMGQAYDQAMNAYSKGEIPVGALIVNNQGAIISMAYNLKETSFNPCSHAEILAIIEAGRINKNWRLTGHTLYVTLEPCPMCLAAAREARVKRMVFGAYDEKGGAISLGINIHQDKRLNHQYGVTGGVLHYQCSQILSKFLRKIYYSVHQ